MTATLLDSLDNGPENLAHVAGLDHQRLVRQARVGGQLGTPTLAMLVLILTNGGRIGVAPACADANGTETQEPDARCHLLAGPVIGHLDNPATIADIAGRSIFGNVVLEELQHVLGVALEATADHLVHSLQQQFTRATHLAAQDLIKLAVLGDGDATTVILAMMPDPAGQLILVHVSPPVLWAGRRSPHPGGAEITRVQAPPRSVGIPRQIIVFRLGRVGEQVVELGKLGTVGDGGLLLAGRRQVVVHVLGIVARFDGDDTLLANQGVLRDGNGREARLLVVHGLEETLGAGKSARRVNPES